MEATVVSSTQSYTEGGSGPPSLSGKVKLIHVHPTLPWVVATLEGTSSSSSSTRGAEVNSMGSFVGSPSNPTEFFLNHSSPSSVGVGGGGGGGGISDAAAASLGVASPSAHHPSSSSVASGGSGSASSVSPAVGATQIVVWDYVRSQVLRKCSFQELLSWVTSYETSVKAYNAAAAAASAASAASMEDTSSNASSGAGGAPSSLTSFPINSPNPLHQLNMPERPRSASAANMAEMRLATPPSPAVVRMGAVRQMQFLDRHTLHWSTGKTPPSQDPTLTAKRKQHHHTQTQTRNKHQKSPHTHIDQQSHYDEHHHHNDQDKTEQVEVEPQLILLCDGRIVVLRLRWFDGGAGVGNEVPLLMRSRLPSSGAMPFRHPRVRFTVSSRTLQGSYPACVTPLSSRVLLIGCADATIHVLRIDDVAPGAPAAVAPPTGRGYSIVQKITVLGINNTADPVVKLLPAPPGSSPEELEMDLDDQQHDDDELDGATHTVRHHHRIISVTRGGMAYLWDFACLYQLTPPLHLSQTHPLRHTPTMSYNNHTNAIPSFGTSSNLVHVRSLPLIRMEGVAIAASMAATSLSMDCTDYDYDREFMIGPFQSAKFLGLWDLSAANVALEAAQKKFAQRRTHNDNDDNNTTAAEKKKKRAREEAAELIRWMAGLPPLHPFLIIRIPNNLCDGVICPSNHPAYADTTLTLLCSTTSNSSLSSSSSSAAGAGTAVGLAAVAGSGAGDGGTMAPADVSFLAASMLTSKEGQMKPEVQYQFGIAASVERGEGGGGIASTGFGMDPGRMRILSMAVPRFRSHILVCGTSVGITVVHLEEETRFRSGGLHASVGDSSGVLFVEGTSLFAATMDSPRPNPVGSLGVTNPALVYKSLLTTADRKLDRQIRRPPRLIVSPSGAFVCLFWVADWRYEILHVDSLLRPQHNNGGATFPPPVDTGGGVSSFAWIGKEDAFAVLRDTTGAALSAAAASSYTAATTTKQSRFDFVKKKVGKQLSTSNASSSSGLNSSSAESGKLLSSLSSSANAVVELRILISVKADATRISHSVAAATTTILGELAVRGGIPAALFGGPVLCVACINQGGSTEAEDLTSEDGMAYFYTLKKSPSSRTTGGGSGLSDAKAALFTAVGPSLPKPDLVEWNEDASLCCVVVGTRVSVYSSCPPQFSLIGTALLAPPEPDARVESVKFVHNVLFCTSRTTVQCIFLGNRSNEETDGGDGTFVDSYVLATSNVSFGSDDPTKSVCMFAPQRQRPLRPVAAVMGLCSPSIVSFCSGSLVVSTPFGLKAVGLNQPLLRIGSLLAAGHTSMAETWIGGIDPRHHEELARFLERRGHPAMAADLVGLPIETVLDLCLKWRLTETMESLIDTHGLANIRKTNLGEGSGSADAYASNHGIVESVGAFLLSEGKAELVRRLASECVSSGEGARREAFVLASMLLAVDPSDARRLVKRAIVAKSKNSTASSSAEEESPWWPVGKYVREHIL